MKGRAAPASLLGDDDLHYFNEGTHARLHDRLGCHVVKDHGAGRSAARASDADDGATGARFAVWAPNAQAVSVIGDFNGWHPAADRLRSRASSGIWEGAVASARRGQCYKYRITARDGSVLEKADPFAFLAEEPPRTASRVWDLEYAWDDGAWMRDRARRNARDAPMSIYEVHLGSWRRVPEDGNRPLTYREAAPLLAEHAVAHGFTHVELLPVMEHPFAGSWGYQVTGYFAPTARFGTPQDLMFLVDHLHQRGIGVLLDWVPAHFPSDAHGLARFDGTHLFEHADPKQGFHPDWNTLIFNYGRAEVRSFLLSSALFWLDRYHADGLRVDGVASMLYLDYSRKEGEWIPNRHGGRENLDAIGFLRQLNTTVYARHPDVQTFAEESTAWPMVSRPVEMGGLGFGFKWDMGWMHDTLQYMAKEPVHRRHHHGTLAFRSVYAHNENFVLPLSHDECVHGKGSLLGKMPGDDWQRFANLRLLLAWQAATPGKKLLFMGGEFGQAREWDHDGSLDWHLADAGHHRGVRDLVRDLNRLHRDEPALHQLDCEAAGFEWIDASDALQSVYAFLRHGRDPAADVLVAVNATPVVRNGYRVGVPRAGAWRELLNTDSDHYGGSGVGNLGAVRSTAHPWHGRPHSVELNLPPLSALFLRHGGDARPERPPSRSGPKGAEARRATTVAARTPA